MRKPGRLSDYELDVARRIAQNTAQYARNAPRKVLGEVEVGSLIYEGGILGVVAVPSHDDGRHVFIQTSGGGKVGLFATSTVAVLASPTEAGVLALAYMTLFDFLP